MRSPEAFVSIHAPIGGKRETKGNETGNERETKRGFLCKIGNEKKTRYGNEAGFFRRLRFLRIRAMRPWLLSSTLEEDTRNRSLPDSSRRRALPP